MAEENGKLILHCGARRVEFDELEKVETPMATATWFPIAHAKVYETVRGALASSGFMIRRTQFGLSRNDARMFATVDLTSELNSSLPRR
jgi:hypothetical protein